MQSLMTNRIYLDHNASAPVLPAVAEVVRDALLAHGSNAGSQHAEGRAARRALETAKEGMLRLLGGETESLDADQLVLTSGGTESNNHALRAFLPVGQPGHLLISAIEHPSVMATAEQLASEGHAVDIVPVGSNGVVSVKDYLERIRPETRLASLMLANNETGVLQPVAELAAECHQRGIPTHTDATQAVGKVPVDFAELGVSLLTFTGHKFHGPLGIGGLIVRGGFKLAPYLAGQAGALRPGTPAVALAMGMHHALELWHQEASDREQRMTHLRDRFEQGLLQRGLPAIIVIGGAVPRLPHTSCVSFAGQNRQALQMALDRAGIACSTGSACASGSSEPSPVLLAMGLPDDQLEGALRFSLGALTTEAEIDAAIDRIAQVCQRQKPVSTT